LNQETSTIKSLGIVVFVAAVLISWVVANDCVSFASAEKVFVAELSGSNEVPPVNTHATGVAKFQLSADGQTLNYRIDMTNINAVMGAHIHSGKHGQNGPVVAGLFNPNMRGPPTGIVHGLLAKGALKSGDLEGPLTGHPIIDLVHLIEGHSAYVNVHTQKHQEGEIRGQIS
jgi:hypothetical protein